MPWPSEPRLTADFHRFQLTLKHALVSAFGKHRNPRNATRIDGYTEARHNDSGAAWHRFSKRNRTGDKAARIGVPHKSS